MLNFLKEVCLLPWETMEFGAVEWAADDKRSVRCNHIYVGCQRPFIIAAESVDSHGVESFGIVVIQDLNVINKFTHGPYPPHNKPVVSMLQQFVGGSSDAYLVGRKEPRLTFGADEVRELKPEMARSLIIEGGGLCVRILADDEVPMALMVSW